VTIIPEQRLGVAAIAGARAPGAGVSARSLGGDSAMYLENVVGAQLHCPMRRVPGAPLEHLAEGD